MENAGKLPIAILGGAALIVLVCFEAGAWGRGEERSVRGGTLSIGREEPASVPSLGRTVFRLSISTVAGLQTRGSGSISAKDLHTHSLRIEIASSGGVSIDSLAADSLEVLISSSGSLRVEGKVDRQDVLLSSSGSYSADALESRTARVRASSSGTATLRVSEGLDAEVSGSGDVRYYGNPPGVNARVTSSGRLVRLGR